MKGLCWQRQSRLQPPRGVTRGVLAGRLGAASPKARSRMAQRIVDLEREGRARPDFLAGVVRALELDAGEVARLLAEDRREYLEDWERWADEPRPVYLVMRIIPGVYCRVKTPAREATREQWEAWAAEEAVRTRRRVCLVLSRRHSTWIDSGGRVEFRTEARPGERSMPFMSLGKGADFVFAT